ncbi:rhodanese-like domain-containing protein [Nocardioides sp. R-C-SC26]|uniref:rhodanese-like domain-containing protein n=1 Tax=Nocardioides sp. R-C-SC26 TaxID=2870414 RepID=UPI001E3E8489|nr:rhodanese-like domain-containing protein [Nocardioides sp. R-C-SC26]
MSDLIAGFGPIPNHYSRMDPLNRRGAGAAAPRAPRPATADDVADAVLSGSWVVDLRTRAAYADGHLPGTVGIEYGTQFATYVGWLVPWDDDLVLLTDTPDDLDDAVRDLARIGIDGVRAHLVHDDAALTATFRRATWSDFHAALDERRESPEPMIVVDVRQRDEWAAGHLRGAVHVPVQDIDRAAGSLPPGELWVHCKSGYRAGIAASVLHREGRTVVHIDDAWEHRGDVPLERTATAA